MNSAELPCGSILRVQPADSNYDNQQQRQIHKKTEAYGEPRDNVLENAESSRLMASDSDKKLDGETDDLDEFFESL